MEMWALVGFLLGTLARGPALSVGLGLVWALVVENLLRGVGALLGPVEAFTKILPGTGGGLAGRLDRRDRRPRRRRRACWTRSAVGRQPCCCSATCVLTPVIAGWLVTRRDVA